MKNHKISYIYFKQSIVLFIISIFIFILSMNVPLGPLGFVVFIRTIFIFIFEYKGYKKYSMIETEKSFEITRGEEKIYLDKEYIISIDKKKHKIFNFYKMTVEYKKNIFIFDYIR